MLSILTDALRTNPQSTAALLYGNRTGDDVMFLDKLAVLAREYGPRFEVLHVLSRENHRPPLLTGRIDRERLPRLLDEIGAGPDDAYYLCGPYALVSDGRDVLAERGASHVRFELFATGGIPAPDRLAATSRGRQPADSRAA